MNWDAFHRRGDVLHAVVAELDGRRDGALPMDLAGVAETFRDEQDLLGALSLKWHTRLSGALERAFAEQPLDFERAVVEAWRDAATDLPGVRRALDAGLQSGDAEIVAMLEKSRDKERELLALWSGRVSAFQLETHGAHVGAEVEQLVRNGFETPIVTADAAPLTFLERLKAAVA